MRLDGYIRVSRVMGREEGNGFYSPDDQRKRIEAHAAAHGHKIVDWQTDLDVSGGKLDQRPGLDAILARMTTGQTDGIAVAYLDRLSRASVTDALRLVEEITGNGKAVVSVDLGLDPTTAMGEMVMTVLLALARMQRRRVTEGWDSTVANAVARGAWPAVTPFGYRKNGDARLAPDPHEKPYLQAIFQRRGNGDTWQSIADWLNQSGVKPRRADQWNSSTVKDICRHEVYLGVVDKQGYRNEHAHEPLVDRAAWSRAQNVNGLLPTRPNGTGYLLAGLLRCAGCGFALTGSTYKRKGKPGVRMYACRRHHGGGDCPAPAAVNASRIEPHLQELFLDLVGELEMQPVQDAPDLQEAEVTLERAEAELAWWATSTDARETFGETAYLAGARERRQAVEKAREAVTESRRRATGIDLPPVVVLREMWPDLSTGERRRLMTAAIDCVMVRRGRGRTIEDRIRLFGKGNAPAGLPRKGRSAPIRSFDW
jgi:site-specific DNA recombinase